ncbi:hypothetical protein F6A46_04040 [Tenacibaculum finnmarkense genomovar ulcerans]|uniref:DUF2586 family protein n=2 Tax=Tenacibaculum finnmarkense TaxID=2781243 RepID=UPI00187B2123|nr:DUF2586 family protein [Tenacibaculum finnmarkense]MBE7687407.1 hypothetical protein [Tenacibaculum finnmarkense genomovar ulcerans]
MSNINGVSIKKGQQGANVLGGADSVSGIIVGAVSAPTPLGFDSPKVVYNMKDVESLGITATFDTTENTILHRHLKEFYRNAGDGTELYLMVVESGLRTMSSICEEQAKRMLAFAKGKIKQIAIAYNEPGQYTMLNGMPENVYSAISKAQGLALWAYNNHMPCQVFLEGYNCGNNAASMANLREIENLNATKVSVFIGQDYHYAETQTKTPTNRQFADVGSLLGICAKAKVNENVGNNEKFNITDATKDAWLEPGLSSHKQNDEIFEDLQTLETKGYLFGLEYTGMAGVRINNDHTCTPIIVDANNKVNEHTIAYGRVLDKAVRGLRTAYLPKVKTDWVVNKDTGKIPPGVVVALEDIGDKVFEDMEQRSEITFGKTFVDKDSDLIVSKELKVSFVLVPKGAIGEIKGTINLKTQA